MTDSSRSHRSLPPGADGLKRLAGILLLPGVLGAGCSNPKIEWADSPVVDVPNYFSSRTSLQDRGGIYRYRLAELPGRVLYQEPSDSTYTFKGLVLKSGYNPTIEPVPENEGKVFDGIITRRAAADASYIAVSASASDSGLMEVHIKDRVLSFISNKDVPWSLLAAESKRAKPTPATKRYWVQGVILASLDYATASEVNLKAGGKLTEAFGANGKVYNKTEKATHDYRISMELINLDDLSTITEVVQNFPKLRLDPKKLGPLVTQLRPKQNLHVQVAPPPSDR
jgi:hypothetical protein